MKTRVVRNRSFLVVAFTGAFLSGCVGSDVDDTGEGVEEDTGSRTSENTGEGPWIGGVFDHRDPLSSNMASADANTPVSEAAAIVNKNGDTNEVIVMMDRDADALRRAVGAPLSFTAQGFPEDALMEAVHRRDPQVLARLGTPLGARYLLGSQRPVEARRMEAVPDSPEDRLNRYLVLRYESVEKAQRASVAMGKTAGIEYVGLSRALSFSAAPNDPYFPVQSIAAQFQWGMHAMNFPGAWDLTPGNAWLGAVDSGVVAHADLQNVRSHLSFVDAASGQPFHGTHVAGIMVATQNNASGVSGGCPSCSMAMGTTDLTSTSIANTISGLVDRGMQVINMSFEVGWTCDTPGVKPICDAIAVGASRDVLLVAAAGNFNKSAPAFPANQADVLAVGGVENVSPLNTWWWQPWYFDAQNGSTAAGMSGVIAPARSIVSTSPVSSMYYNAAFAMCGDAAGYDESGTLGDGFGSCTGTSMAAPHVAALGGLIRSVNPRLSSASVRNIIRQNSSQWTAPTAQLGSGLPSAYSAVVSAYNQTPNRLTPLFSFYSAGRLDYFYTSVPQMASAAIAGTLQPRVTLQPGGGTSPPSYATLGTGISGYSSFPGFSPVAGRIPTAEVWIFTTPQNPKNASIPLAPLYRLSWKCGDAGYSPACASTPAHTDFVYTADPNGVAELVSWGYKLDGIEGYIFPKTIAQPPGSVRLMRKYNPTRDDHAIFPESKLAAMQAQGYTMNSGSDWLGYVYPNINGAVPAIQ